MSIATRAIIEQMALELMAVPDLANDHQCIMSLLATGRFKASEIVDYLDPARDLARQVRIDEGELWNRLQGL